MSLTLSNVLREVCKVLRDYFEQFALIDIEVLEANIDELLEPDAIERLKMMEHMESNDV
jgi:hypothetical protein